MLAEIRDVVAKARQGLRYSELYSCDYDTSSELRDLLIAVIKKVGTKENQARKETMEVMVTNAVYNRLAFLDDEDFIDNIVERIKRKQLGS